MVVVVVVVVVVLILGKGLGGAVIQAGSVQHPQAHPHHNQRGGQQQIGLRLLSQDGIPKRERQGRNQPYDDGVRQGGTHSQQRGLARRSFDGDDECGHQGFGVPWLQSVQRADQDGCGNKQPQIGRSVLDQFGDGGHGGGGVWCGGADCALATA